MVDTRPKSSLRDTVESLVVTVILAVFGTTFVVQAFKIPTGSMEVTLLVGDHLLVNKFAFARETGFLRRWLPYRHIHRGDVLVFKYPSTTEDQSEPGEHYVKRVIGLPGDHIRVKDRQVYINGVPLKEPYVHHTHIGEAWPGDDFPVPNGEFLPTSTATWMENQGKSEQNGEIVVPPGNYFMMGDNRENSWDSRFWGFVPRKLISGRPLLIYWSFKTPHDEYLQSSLSDRISQVGDLIIHFFSKTRWQRTFRLVR